MDDRQQANVGRVSISDCCLGGYKQGMIIRSADMGYCVPIGDRSFAVWLNGMVGQVKEGYTLD